MNRKKYIKDGEYDEDNNYLQSDVVLILMNLCAIPDDVVKKLTFDYCYGDELLVNMDEFKGNFKKEHKKVEWKYSDEDMLTKYLEFKEKNGSFKRSDDYLMAKQDLKRNYWKQKYSTRSTAGKLMVRKKMVEL